MADLVASMEVQAKNAMLVRMHLQVQGCVQGVGFRPFVYNLATRHQLNGHVRNDSAGVSIEVEGMGEAVDAFKAALVNTPPPMAHIEYVSSTPLPIVGETDFSILPSQPTSAAHTLISPDIALCDDCLAELLNPANRRYRYPFINCTNCGPRYTIIHNVPYDRPLTTMAEFTMCPDCQSEYDNPADRRFHAQPNACPTCGPHVEFRWASSTHPQQVRHAHLDASASTHGDEDALAFAQRLLVMGGILAVKGIGGFHLACDATNARAVDTLRRRKARADKPLAIMARDLPSVLSVAHANAEEIALLGSPQRPIVLLRKRTNSPLAATIAPGNAYIGVMLPYAPLHHLLFAPPPTPATIKPAAITPSPWLVMTSGNHRDEPIVIDNHKAQTRLGDLADAFLLHNRAIHLPCDDSVVRDVAGTTIPIRRARGYAPLPVTLPVEVPPILAVGGEVKNAFCLARGHQAFMSQHIGDMVSLETQQHFGRTVQHMQKLFHIQPQVIACDRHPGYLSTQWAAQCARHSDQSVRLVQVQHHHAHIAALMAEHGLPGDEPVIGFCFDGTGYGLDGAIWGGEMLIADYRTFTRAAHLAYFPLPGGDAAIHKPYRAALAALWSAGIEWEANLFPVRAAPASELAILRRQLETNLNCVQTSSMGRLFDTVAALCGVRQQVTYEAQAAIELEAVAHGIDDPRAYAFDVDQSGIFDASPLLRAIINDVGIGRPIPQIANRFHNAIADLILALSLRARTQLGLNQVALSGGVFQNVTLLQRTVHRLHDAHFTTLTHRRVPPNDGGLALGQAIVAAHSTA